MEQGEWITTTPAWVELPVQKNYGRRKSDTGGGSGQISTMEEEQKSDMDPSMRVLENFQDFLNSAYR